MAKYTRQQIEDALIQAGMPRDAAVVLSAVAIAESGGDSNNNLHTTKENSWGVFQINLMAHPDVTEACARDLTCSARAALQISSGGTNFSPWTKFRDGGYQAYLPIGWLPHPGYSGVPAVTHTGNGTPASPQEIAGNAGPLAGQLGSDLSSAVLSGLGLPAIAPSALVKGAVYVTAAAMGFTMAALGVYGLVSGKRTMSDTYRGAVGAVAGTAKMAAKTAAVAA